MRRLTQIGVLTAFLLISGVSPAMAWNPLSLIFGGGGGPKIDVSKKNTELTGVKQGIQDNKLAVEALGRNKLTAGDVESLVKATIEAQIEAKITAYDRSQKAGRDIITIKKNSGYMIMYIVGGILSTMGIIIGSLIGLIIKQMYSKAKAERLNDKKQYQLINRLIAAKLKLKNGNGEVTP